MVTLMTSKVMLALLFIVLASLNLFVLIQANQLAFSQNQQPYDFYVLLHASSQVFSNPSLVYAHQDTSTLPSYWAKWLWYGATYLYTPMFATLLSPLSTLFPPYAKIIWEGFSYVLLLLACVAVLKPIESTKVRIALMLMIFVMPIQVIYTNQTLPQYWLPQMPGMWISPVFFADYYWGNTNTAVLALGLLSFYFAVKKGDIDFGVIKIPGYAFSSLFLALESLKITATLLVLPFYLLLSQRKLFQSIGLLMMFTVVLNGVAFFEPALLTGYITAIASEPQGALWQVYEYVWYYTLPLTGIALLWQQRHKRTFTNGFIPKSVQRIE